MAVTRPASMRLARPSTAFCSCRAVGNAAQGGGDDRRKGRIAAEADHRAGFDGAEQRIGRDDAAPSLQAVVAAAIGERPARVADGTR